MERVWEQRKGPEYETKRGTSRMDSKGIMKSDNNNKKGEVGNNNKRVINKDVCVCLCAG